MPITTTPVRLRWMIDNVRTVDAHRLDIGFTCSLVLVDEPAEKKLFAEVFGQTSAVQPQAIVNHFLTPLRAAAAEVANGQPAQNLLSPGAKAQWIAALKTAANQVGFDCGIEVLAPFEFQVVSPTLQQERLEQMQRIAAERRSADRVEHFAKAADLLKQWESLKASVPAITPGKLLEQVNPSDRGLMLDTLLMAGATGLPDLWAVSGSHLVQMDVKTDSPLPQLIPLPATAGPLRSVRWLEGQLIIGARNGVMMVDPTKTHTPKVYLHPALSSEHGFTSVARIEDHIWACHRAGGLVAWEIDRPDQPVSAQTPIQLAGEPVHLINAGLFAVGSRLMKIPDQFLFDTKSSIVAILKSDNQIIVVSENGSISVMDDGSFQVVNTLLTNGRITGAALLPWLSSSRLLLARQDGPIDCIGLEDQLITQFNAGQTGLRATTACGGKVAAMSNDRQRIVLWNAWDGRRLAGEIHLTGQTHHRITDLTFACG